MRRTGWAAAVSILSLVIASACTGDDPTLGSSSSGSSGDGGTSLGTACNATTPCANGVCVDGVCCESSCTGLCEACNVPGQEGRCVAVSGKPHHGTCDGDATGPCAGACDGNNRAACTYPDTACGSPSCAGGTATLATKCSAGKCPAAPTQPCALGCFEDGCLGVKQIAAGYYHACAALTDGKVRCWGRNNVGQTGQNGTTPIVTPKEVPGLSNVTAVAATFQATCALLADKTVKCWGGNTSGELGRAGSIDASDTPHPVPELADLTGATFIAGGSGNTFCAIVANGAIRCWGANYYGQLGDGTATTAGKTSPVTVCAPDSTNPCPASSGATFVASGDNHACAIFAGNKVACWGNNSQGQLGRTPTGGTEPTPKTVTGLAATYLTGGNQLTCAAATDGSAKCWGTNFGNGRLGNGMDDGVVTSPASVCTKQDCSTFLGGVTAITTYDESSCALASGAVKCWGINTGGQLGDGNASASQNYAATTAIAKDAVYVTSGGGANYAIVVDGANRDVRCWGNEGYNQCGDGTTSGARKTPIAPKW